MKLTTQQTAALEMVKNNRLSLLIGFPGTGKTTITKKVVEWATKEKDFSIALASPTGKAANVLSEACNYPASTIHRLLRPLPIEENGKLKFIFECNADNPLEYDFIIIDECSMIGNDLMSDLFKAIAPNRTKVLMIGDSCQLPSVQPGNILYDMISSKVVPITELTEVFRHSGAIVDFCTAVRTDTPFVIPTNLNPDSGQNYCHIECGNSQAIHDTVVKLATENMVKRGYDVTQDVQILSPVNSKTVLSCDALNESIQNIVNPQPKKNCIENSIFRLKSKVINTKNIYDAVSFDTNYKEMILNGDMGIIIDLFDEGCKKMIVKFENPTREIILNKYSNHLKLAYCLTIHRSQGSQFPVVILPVHSAFKYQNNRALIYTAASRAQSILITVGQATAIRQAVGDIKVYQRQTFLKEKIQDKMLDAI